MLKGTMKIQLTDVHTGEKKTVVEHNMITNALTELFKPLGLIKAPSKVMNSWAPYYQTLIGGILLFDNNIEENPNNVYPPATANLIGCASYNEQNNTTGTTRGGYNQTESELNLTNRYMKFVYDFATSQANGTISSVCLTHKQGGFTGYGSDSSIRNSSYNLALSVDDGTLQYVHTNYTGGNTGDKYSGLTLEKSEMLFLIDRQNDIAYYFRVDNATSIQIIKRRAYLQSVSVLENPYTQKALIEDFPLDTLTTEMPTSYFSYNYDYVDHCLYIFSSPSYYRKTNETFIVTKISILNWQVTQYTMTNTTDVNLSTNGMRYGFVHNGFLYLKSYSSPYEIYKFEVGNSANVVKIHYPANISSIDATPQLAINERIYYEYSTSSTTNSRTYVVNAQNNSFLYPEAYRINGGSNQPCYTPVLDEPMLYFCSYGNWSTSTFIVLANYLATINNLSEPVTKTADKTMKVTYIIQEQ